MSVAAKIVKYIETGDPMEAMCFAVPGYMLIDIVNPDTGKTAIYGKSLDEVRQNHHDAILMGVGEFCRSKAASQDTAITWHQVTEEKFYDMLGCLPPACHTKRGFLVGEPSDHHAITGKPRFQAYLHQTCGDDDWQEHCYYVSNRAMTVSEFRTITEGA